MSLAEKQQQRLAAANAISGKTARACDSCLWRRVRWYCIADDAFLCQSCDSSVHSVNPLARCHNCAQLNTSSSLSSLLSPPPSDLNAALPQWQQGFMRKARTPRQAKSSVVAAKAPVLVVPDLEAIADDKNGCDGEMEVDEEEQLLYQVPIFDPVLAEFCSPVPFIETNLAMEETKPVMNNNQLLHADQNQGDGFAGFNPSDIELAEFAADVDNLLGQGLDDDSFCIDGLGLHGAKDDGDNGKVQVKIELMNAIDTSAGGTNFLVGMEREFSCESLELNFDCGSARDEEGEQKVETIMERNGPTKVGLKLDYEAVITAWSCRGCSPWTDGERPQFIPDDCWPDFMGMWPSVGGDVQATAYGEMRLGGQVGNGDGGREARVSRYREKRRTRLFSKKIRYKVRKLNAEMRPRMKGRFAKRAPFPAAAAVAAGGSVTHFRMCD